VGPAAPSTAGLNRFSRDRVKAEQAGRVTLPSWPAWFESRHRRDLAYARNDESGAAITANPALMASRRSEKERWREGRVAHERAAEEWAKRRERRIYIGLAAGLLVLAVVTVVIVSSRSSGTPNLPPAAPSTQAVAAASSAPAGASARAVLTVNVREANQILGTTIQAKVAQLPGVPVVINQWASWCTNCRFEFPFFQRAGRQDANWVAFVGLDSQDSRSSAQAFLREFPVDYPSVFDPTASQAQSLGGGQGWPTTIFLNSKHQITNVHIGAYPTLQALQQDIDRHA
jgi:thiol-disulfide isomerase/thioredoxin